MKKEEFLQVVREALGRDIDAEPPDYPTLGETLAQQQLRAKLIEERNDKDRLALVNQFVDMAQKAGWEVSRAETPEEATRQIADLAQEQGAKRVVRSDQEIFHSVAIDDILGKTGISVVPIAKRLSASPSSLRQAIIEADLGVTGADYAIAETGSCVIVPRQGLSRLVSLIPPVHIAIVETRQIVASLDDIFTLRRIQHTERRDGVESSMNFITGPSRTGDIEQTIVTGVHGPKLARLILI